MAEGTVSFPAPRLFLVAGEVSGDIYGAALVRGLRRLRPDLELWGVGGPRMAAAGMRCLLDSSGWGMIGWLDVLPSLPSFLLRLVRVRRAITRLHPAAVILIDFPGFNLPLARRLEGRFPVAYFIPPMVSTRRGDRAGRIARLGLRLLAVLPFEAEAYRAAGADVLFVGHPALDAVQPGRPREEIRRRLGVPAATSLVALMPGSREQEIRRHLPVVAEALPAVQARFPGLRAVLLLAAPRFHPLVAPAMRRSPVPITLVQGGGAEGYAALAAADFAVIASGTATLEALVLGVPHVLIYRLSPITYGMARRIAAVPWAGLPSLLAGRMVTPELIQDALSPARLAATVIEWLGNAAARAKMQRELLALRDRLGPPGAAERAAREILRLARLLGADASSTIQTT